MSISQNIEVSDNTTRLLVYQGEANETNFEIMVAILMLEKKICFMFYSFYQRFLKEKMKHLASNNPIKEPNELP